MDARVGIEPTMGLLQRPALPLGYPAPLLFNNYLISFIWVSIVLII